MPDIDIKPDENINVSHIPFLKAARIEDINGRSHLIVNVDTGGVYFLTKNTQSDHLAIPIYLLPLNIEVKVGTRWYGIEEADTYLLTLSENKELSYEPVTTQETTGSATEI